MKFSFQTAPGVVVLIVLLGCMTSSQSDISIHPDHHKLSKELIRLHSVSRHVSVKGTRVQQMKTTGYCPCGKCCSWILNGKGIPVYARGSNAGKPKAIGFTASGYPAERGVIAADPKYPFGTVISVPGYTTGIVLDRGGAITGESLDLFFPTHTEAKKWGVKTLNVTLWSSMKEWRASLSQQNIK